MDGKRYVNVPFTQEEYRVIQRAMDRFRCRSMAEFCHQAAFHFAGHNRSTVRPVRAWQSIEGREVPADPASEAALSLAGHINLRREMVQRRIVDPLVAVGTSEEAATVNHRHGEGPKTWQPVGPSPVPAAPAGRGVSCPDMGKGE